MRIAKGCLGWVLTPVILSIVFLVLTISVNFFFLAFLIPFLLVSIFFLVFFRDPSRVIGEGVVAPADGVIRDIKKDEKEVFISIFMEVNNVHVNRMPVSGKIKKITHYPGKHLRAWKKESDYNERVNVDIDSSIGLVKVVQIAGLIARRVYPYIEKGDMLEKGERFGIIRLGSRVDVYLPADKIKRVTVKNNDPVLAGVTTIAKVKS